MSLIEQADRARSERPLPMQVVQLDDAKASLVDIGWDTTEHRVMIEGTDGQGVRKHASIPFASHFRAEAAVLVDEIGRTGSVAMKGLVQFGTKSFDARTVESGDASLDLRHSKFDAKRLLSYGLNAIRGRSTDQIEEAAIMAHRAKAIAER